MIDISTHTKVKYFPKNPILDALKCTERLSRLFTLPLYSFSLPFRKEHTILRHSA